LILRELTFFISLGLLVHPAFPNGSDEGRREWGIRGGEQSTGCRMPEARLALTVRSL
jgi:hypothetical protein